MKKDQAVLLVRAEVRDAHNVAKFDAWYEDEHLPDAVKAFGALQAWRGWSQAEPRAHHAYYVFASEEDAHAILNGNAIKALIAEFDATWGDQVTRSRQVIKVAGSITTSSDN